MEEGIIGTPGHSPALRYEVQLAELSTGGGGRESGPAPARISSCFEILDKLIPQLGVFQRVMRMVREELFAAVYSEEYTVSSGRPSRKGKPERLPYFTIARRQTEKRNLETAKLEGEIASLKEQLYTCEADVEKASTAIEAYRRDVKERDAKIHRLSSELRSRTAECERLQKIVGQHQRVQDRLRKEVEYHMFSLRNTIAGLKEENTHLRRYKDTHHEIQRVLAQPKPFHPVSTDGPPATKTAQLQQQVATAELLQRQLMEMQNLLLDEYDSYLNARVGEMADEDASDAHREIRQQQQYFRENIAAITNELSLLQAHSVALSSQLEQLASAQASSLGPQAAFVDPLHPANPLLPQEHPLSKYATMLFTSSDGGTTFFPLKEAQLCSNCGDKTVICPHKACAGELLVQLPLGSTHLRITRPSLKVETGQESRPKKKEVSKPPKPVSRLHSQHILPPDFVRIWNHFHSKISVQRTVPRTLTAEQLMVLVYQFYSSVLAADEVISVSGEEDSVPSLLDSLYGFMGERYCVPEVAGLATHDFLSTLEQHCDGHKEFLVLSKMLSGHLDGAAFRYLLLLSGLVDRLPWASVKEFGPFAASIYPSMQEEDVEQLTMNFIAHSGNRVSRHLVVEFLSWLLLRHREPRVLQLESRLNDHPCRQSGSMLEGEFAEALEQLVPLVPDHLLHRLFLQSRAQLQESRETTPTKRLAYVVAYLSLLRSAPTIAAQLDQQVQRWAAVATHHTPASTTTTGPQLHTMDTVRAMASRMK